MIIPIVAPKSRINKLIRNINPIFPNRDNWISSDILNILENDKQLLYESGGSEKIEWCTAFNLTTKHGTSQDYYLNIKNKPDSRPTIYHCS